MSRCIVAVAYGEKYEKMGDLMIESFMKYNKGWDAVRIYGNAIRVPVACMPNGVITPMNACEIGRWIAMRELLDKYDEVLYCDNDIHWYGKYKPLKADVVLYPHYVTNEAKYNDRFGQFYNGLFNAGILYVKNSDGKKACDFIIQEVVRNPKHFIWNENGLISQRNGGMFLQEIISVIPEIGLNCKIDNNPGINVAYWNVVNGERNLIEKNGVFCVECNGVEFCLQCFHFSNYCFDRLPMLGNIIKKMFMEYEMRQHNCLYTMRNENNSKGLRDLIEKIFSGRKNLIGIEIGSYQGESAEIFLSTGKFDKLYCIDAWKNGYDDTDSTSYCADIAEEAFDKRIGNDERIIKIKGFSFDVANMIPDGCADFLYVDGCHTKEAVAKDLKMYCRKVKEEGILSGHDYNYNIPRLAGVIEAVDEFLGHKPENTFCDTSWSNRKNEN